MEIYGLGIVALCMFIGSFAGRAAAGAMGVEGDVGGVGFSMLLLIFIARYMEKRGRKLSDAADRGIRFLGMMYIPVVIALSANQNVAAAVDGGVIAIASGVIATIGSLFLVPIISKLGSKR